MNKFSRRIAWFAYCAAVFTYGRLYVPLAVAQTPNSSSTVTCDTPTSKGAVVDSKSRCQFFFRYVPDKTTPDPRIVANLHLKPNEPARSIAVVVGVGKYKNSEYNIEAADEDVAELKKFLIDRQKFDEVIVLQDEQVNIETIRYFLRSYAMDRTNFYQGKVRFLFAYSGHGIQIPFYGDSSQPESRKPSVGLAMSATMSDDDFEHIYGLNELRALFNDLGKNTYHFLALINACYGGDVFGEAKAGGSADDLTERGATAITAGRDDKEVYSTPDGNGSLFFHTIITGVDSGDADLPAQKATLKLPGSFEGYYGVVRLGELDGYITTEIRRKLMLDPSSDALEGNLHHWSGSVEPFDVRSDGGFFFFQRTPSLTTTSYQAKLQESPSFVPSQNQLSVGLGTQLADGFESLRSSFPPPVRGVDVSHHNANKVEKINWQMVANQGFKFAYIKATESSSFTDDQFQYNWQKAKEAGLARGAYHVFGFCDDVNRQISHIIDVVGKAEVDPSDLPIAIDVEGFPITNYGNGRLDDEAACAARLSDLELSNRLNVISDVIETKFKKRPIVYATEFILRKISQYEHKYGIWRTKPGLATSAPPPPWILWQYTQNERVAGIYGPVDVNVLSESK